MALSLPESLNPSHDLSSFVCGAPELDSWLKTRALSNQEKGFTAVVVVHEDARVVGFYGLAPTAVVASVMPRSIRTGQPPDPVPCLLLGQFAVDRRWSGKGIGSALLRDALGRCLKGASLVRGRVFVVTAINAGAASFWRRHGFLESRDDPLVLLRSMSDIAATVASETGSGLA